MRFVPAALTALTLAAGGLLAPWMAPPAAAQASLVTETPAGEGKGRPLMEAGLFLGAAWLPDYPAASQGSLHILPFPYAIYRGPVFKIGDGGLARANAGFFDGWVEFDLGLSGSFDSDSKDNRARDGMPNLDLLLEAGPAITLHTRARAEEVQLDVTLEARGVISLNTWGVGYEGIIVNPKLVLMDRNFLDTGSLFYASAGPVWGYDGIEDYFYAVAPRYARADRPAYEGKAGYIGTRGNIGIGFPVTEHVRLFTGLQFGYYGGSANDDSPLYRDKWNIGAGAGFTWSFWQSKARAPGDY